MPFDSVTFKLPAVKPATFDPVLREGLAGLAQLEEALLHSEWWSSHRWTFEVYFQSGRCGTAGCAIGVMCAVWPGQFPNPNTSMLPTLARRLGLSIDEYCSVFLFSSWVRQGHNPFTVTPVMVANAIDALLAAKGWKG
jgi:hypothetical protein